MSLTKLFLVPMFCRSVVVERSVHAFTQNLKVIIKFLIREIRMAIKVRQLQRTWGNKTEFSASGVWLDSGLLKSSPIEWPEIDAGG